MTDKTPFPDEPNEHVSMLTIDPAVLALCDAVMDYQDSANNLGVMFNTDAERLLGRVRAWQKAITVRLNAAENGWNG